jgi:hypothetical protein
MMHLKEIQESIEKLFSFLCLCSRVCVCMRANSRHIAEQVNMFEISFFFFKSAGCYCFVLCINIECAIFKEKIYISNWTSFLFATLNKGKPLVVRFYTKHIQKNLDFGTVSIYCLRNAKI